ncbi:hypothetical protein ACSBR2_015910 [Camellia fascicularis]
MNESSEGGKDLYIRLATSDLARKLDNRSRKVQDNNQRVGDEEDQELLLFDLAAISSATNNFSFANKIGESGFGLVYQDELATRREIAVKRLSKTSRQGLKEFKNEVMLISKLQHRNLVRLLGCCIHEEERMLIYEYMPNKSLDTFIINFGLARSFGCDQSEKNTNGVIGTYDYMSPEYAINGHFSMKSDIFSFGVLVLEIVSGKKNRGFYDPDHDLNLLGHAWKLWNEGTPIKLFDVFMEDPIPTSEVLRCIQVTLLCVQQRLEDRPTMSYVLLMLYSENPVLPMPKQPNFYSKRVITNIDYSSTGKHHCTTNEVTITMLHGR